jgi:uncharacterized membrane protein
MMTKVGERRPCFQSILGMDVFPEVNGCGCPIEGRGALIGGASKVSVRVAGETDTSQPGGRHYDRDSGEFGRIVNLSDAVFAIAMTLLVFTFERPEVPADQLGAALANQYPELIAFVLSFALVANAWWLHHKFFALLRRIEPGLIAINLLLLMTVALVPFPTSLIGKEPTAQAAVLPYIAVLITLSLLYAAMLVRARAADLWRVQLPAGLFPWLLAGWAVSIAVLIAAFAVAIWLPVAGLALLPVNGIAELFIVARRAPAAYRTWA